jgi:hypothetical protein
MNDASSQLPWQELWHKEGPIPWSALEVFAEAVTVDADVSTGLFEAYDKVEEVWLKESCYVDLYVPAIFTMAAPHLSEERRRPIGEFLLKRLVKAGHDDNDLGLESLTVACGSLGSTILPAVFDAIEQEQDSSGAWFFLWSLTALAAQTDDTAIRDRTVQVCARLLERIDRAEIDEDLGIDAAWTLALLERTEYAELLERLGQKCAPIAGGSDYREAARHLRGQADSGFMPQMWEEPIGKLLTSWWETARDWFAAHRVLEDADRAEWAQTVARVKEKMKDLPEPASPIPIAPIREYSPKIGRNDPCPCGSGKKYKKCCGNPTKGQTTGV